MAGAVVVADPPIRRALRPFREFARVQASGGIVLLACTVLALVWANSPWAASYHALWHTEVTVGADGFGIRKDLLHWINDGLMAVFFFVVGLEIKREVLVGELADLRRAALPIAAAAGGMIVPALLYASINWGGAGIVGWGVPMATDIAFALGVLALLGRRAPLALKVFLTALAIVDDIGAVLVIAVFYTAQLNLGSLAVGIVLIGLLFVLNFLGARNPLTYVLIGLAVWAAFLQSGVHATIAGVLLAATIPAWVRIDVETFVDRAHRSLHHLADAASQGRSVLSDQVQQHALHDLESACEDAQAPVQRLEHALHPWVSFVIMPVFALANAGVTLEGGALASLASPVSLGVIVGLVLGKQIGITLFAWLAVRSGMAALPASVTWRHVYGAGWLGGIGFTMSLFISGLAFPDAALLATAKLGILVASTIAGVVGFLIVFTARPPGADAEQGDEREAAAESTPQPVHAL